MILPRSLIRLIAASVPLFGLAVLNAQTPEDLKLSNEAGTLTFTLQIDDAGLPHRVDHLEKNVATPVIERSPLGLTRTDLAMTSGLTFVAATPAKVVEDDYTLSIGKQLKVQSRGRERTFSVRTVEGVLLELTVRAYRDGIAFRYALPGHGSQFIRISGESTGFKLPAGGHIWAQPYSKIGIWSPAYEANYVNGVPVGTAAPAPEGWALPLLYHNKNLWVLITESDLEPTYFGVHLEQNAPEGLYTVRLPENPETFGVAPQAANITLPWASPWRVIIVAPQASGIVESTLVTDVARPSEIKDPSWVVPGVASWSWWSDMSSLYDYNKLVPFIDVSAKLGWKYSLLDLGWQYMKNGDLQKITDYAKTKNVGILVWYNSGGKKNKSPEDKEKPDKFRDVLSDPILREAEFARVAAIGVRGIKVDFMQSDKQFVIAQYHDILRDAAKYKLMVDFHGCTIPRGWQRTYPNLVSMEAVRGAEQYWDTKFAEDAQMYHTIYVFTRNAVGPMDYTPTVFTDVAATNQQIKPHLTTYAHELALLVVFESGIQHVVDSASSLVTQPEFVQDYLNKLPTAWDESRLIDGAPGELAILARRLGKTWYLSGINGETTAKSIAVPLSFLGATKYEMSLITDGAAANQFAHAAKVVGNKDELKISLAGRGGFAARLIAR